MKDINVCRRYLIFAVTALIINYTNAFGKTHSNVSSVPDTSIIANGAKPQLVSKQFSFTEGPAVDKYGNIFFTDQPNNKIWKYSTKGKLSVFLDNAGRSNGMYFDGKGNLVACADEHNQLWSIDPERKVTVLVKDFHGHQLNGPNDLWIDAEGSIFFTDPYYQRDYWERKEPDPGIGGERLYFMVDEKSEPVIADSDLVKPNGIVGTPDGKYLYVADMGVDKTFIYEINKDGRLSNRKVFVNQSSDGMTLDNRGNLYLTGNGVTVYNSKGEKIEQIDIPEKWTANVCFGGKNRNILFITASEAVYILQMNVNGIE